MFPLEGRLLTLAMVQEYFGNYGSGVMVRIIREDFTVDESTDYADIDALSQSTINDAGNVFENAPAAVDGKARLTGNQITWTNTLGSEQTVYGWAVLHEGDSKLLNAKKFATPQVIAEDQDLEFTPYIQCNILD